MAGSSPSPTESGLAPRHLAGRRRRARADPRGDGELEVGSAVALERASRADRIRSWLCSSPSWPRSAHWCIPPATPRPDPRARADRLAAPVDRDRARRRRALGADRRADAGRADSILWTPVNLENLAKTYWRFLSRVTARADPRRLQRARAAVMFLARPITLLRFDAPEYVLEPDHGSVIWTIRDGLLVARAGRGCGCLSLDVRRRRPGRGRAREGRIEVEVANFYPSIASGFSTLVYEATQCVPRARHTRLPALAGAARAGRVEGRPVRAAGAAGRAAFERARHAATTSEAASAASGPRGPHRAADPRVSEAPLSRSGRRSAPAASRGRGAPRSAGRCPSASASPATRWSRPGALIANPLEHVAVGDAGGREEHVLPADQVVEVRTARS